MVKRAIILKEFTLMYLPPEIIGINVMDEKMQ